MTRPDVEALVRFGLVGASGVAVNWLALEAWDRAVGDPYSAWVFGWCVAVTTNWWLNRRFTFGATGRVAPPVRQWAKFVLVNLSGGAVNFVVYSALVWSVSLCREHLAVPLVLGTLAGLVLNFLGSRRLVFRG